MSAHRPPEANDAAWRVRVLTLLPEAFPGILAASLAGQALESGLWSWSHGRLLEKGIAIARCYE